MIRPWLRARLDNVGLVAHTYDLRAYVGYALDWRTQRANARFRATGSPDGLPLPPPLLVYLVAGHFNLRWYYESGISHERWLRDALATNGVRLDDLAAVLDFGCGCGRVTRHWHGEQSLDIYGTDYNRRLVDWCRRSLSFANFETNGHAPPLPYDDARFSFIYAISVFTHLAEGSQHAWMRELERVLAPGGLLAITTKGRSRVERLGDDERVRFERGELVVQDERYAGRNLCAAYHPERYVRELLADDLEVLDFVPAVLGGEQSQDLYLLGKPRSVNNPTEVC
jgi:SAM-dependent methyltransferase